MPRVEIDAAATERYDRPHQGRPGMTTDTSAITLAPAAAATPTKTVAAERKAGLDALRAAVTLLVLFHHSAITYGAIGGWFYREVPTDDAFGTKLLILFCTVNQAFFMGLFFLLAGYFTPGAVARHGVWAYVRERLLRLGLPLLAFGVLIGPATIALAQTARGRPFLATLTRLFERGTFENGPLWFAQALLIFAVAYLAWHALARWRSDGRPAGEPHPFPSNLALGLAALLTGAAAFALRLVWPVGTQVFGLQLAYFASYIVLFAAGCIGAAGRWLDHVPDGQRRLWLGIAGIAFPVLPALYLLSPLVPAFQGNSSGGWNAQAIAYAFWEPLMAWGLIMGLVHGFGQRFATLGPSGTALARRAYTIFIIHPPVLVAVALAWRDIAAPHLVKFAVTGTVTCLLCYWIAGLLLRVPALRRVL